VSDGDTGLVRFGARDYMTDAGRWMSADPLRLNAGLNAYEYAGSDPVHRSDRTGMLSDCTWAVLATGAGAVACAALIDVAQEVGIAMCIALGLVDAAAIKKTCFVATECHYVCPPTYSDIVLPANPDGSCPPSPCGASSDFDQCRGA
jgi:RHS repeat-associated protein